MRVPLIRPQGVAIIVILLAVLGVIAFDLAQVQAGLERPSDEVLATAAYEIQTAHKPDLISSYETFSVPVEKDVLVTVYRREVANAIGNILMIHGAGGGAWAWEVYFDLLPTEYNVYALSWRGHFDSSPVEDANTTDYVKDQRAVFEAIRKRNALPIHLIGHSYGGATAVLMTAQMGDEITSLHLIAPVVPLDYSFIQAQLLPLMAPFFIAMENDIDGVYGGMFLAEERMTLYYDLYAGKDFSIEKSGLISEDGVSPRWQVELTHAYQALANADLPIWMFIARYDNVVVSARQRAIAREIKAKVFELESGHYIQLDTEAEASVDVISSNLSMLYSSR